MRLLYPASCGACSSLLELEEKGICVACRIRLARLRFDPGRALLDRPFKNLGKAWCLYPYASPVKEILAGIKFLGKRWLLRVFRRDFEWITPLLALEHSYDALTPVPLHVSRLLTREFNQAEIAAEHLSAASGIPLMRGILKKSVRGPAQSTLGRRERRLNLFKTFEVPAPEKIRGKTFLLVDDILTSGATAEEAAGTLRKAGARRVDLFALAATIERAPALEEAVS